MSRPVSNILRQAVFAQETAEVFILLLTIDHDDLSDPIRVTADPGDVMPSGAKGIVSNEVEYIFYPFDLTLPNEDEEASPRAKLQIDNVTQEIVATLRSLNSPPRVSLQIVLASQPDIVEARLVDFQLRNVVYDVSLVTGDLTIEQFDLEPFPASRITPSRFAGVF